MEKDEYLNKVPFVIVGAKEKLALRKGKLSNIAPTILDLLGLEYPSSFEEGSLIQKNS